jgi:hypothetical protein
MEKERNKRDKNRKRRNQIIPICRCYNPILEGPKHSTKKLLNLISTFRKIAKCKININKSVAFLYTNNEHTEKEIRKATPFTIASKKSNT